MWRLRSFVAIGTLAASLAAHASSAKAVWEWTVEERISARTDAQAARERVRRRGRATVDATSARDPELAATVDSFDGKTHPELFLPHEVFRTLISHAFLGAPRAEELFRRGLTPRVQRHGLPSDFWPRLESIASAYIASASAEIELGAELRAQRGAARDRFRRELTAKQLEVCGHRAAALEAARRDFGAERFDRFLYEAIAVNMFHVADSVPDAEVLRQHARGCK